MRPSKGDQARFLALAAGFLGAAFLTAALGAAFLAGLALAFAAGLAAGPGQGLSCFRGRGFAFAHRRLAAHIRGRAASHLSTTTISPQTSQLYMSPFFAFICLSPPFDKMVYLPEKHPVAKIRSSCIRSGPIFQENYRRARESARHRGRARRRPSFPGGAMKGGDRRRARFGDRPLLRLFEDGQKLPLSSCRLRNKARPRRFRDARSPDVPRDHVRRNSGPQDGVGFRLGTGGVQNEVACSIGGNLMPGTSQWRSGMHAGPRPSAVASGSGTGDEQLKRGMTATDLFKTAMAWSICLTCLSPPHQDHRRVVRKGRARPDNAVPAFRKIHGLVDGPICPQGSQAVEPGGAFEDRHRRRPGQNLP